MLFGEDADDGAADEPAGFFVFELDAIDVAPAAVEIDHAGAFARIDARAHRYVLVTAVAEENIEVVEVDRIVVNADFDACEFPVAGQIDDVDVEPAGDHAFRDLVPSQGGRGGVTAATD